MIAGALLMALASPAFATEAGDWAISVGAHSRRPGFRQRHPGERGVRSRRPIATGQPTITAEYFFSPNLGLEVLASLPFDHDIYLNGVEAGSTRHLPPTFTLAVPLRRQDGVALHRRGSSTTPWFYDQDTTGPLDGHRTGPGKFLGPDRARRTGLQDRRTSRRSAWTCAG